MIITAHNDGLYANYKTLVDEFDAVDKMFYGADGLDVQSIRTFVHDYRHAIVVAFDVGQGPLVSDLLTDFPDAIEARITAVSSSG